MFIEHMYLLLLLRIYKQYFLLHMPTFIYSTKENKKINHILRDRHTDFQKKLSNY